MGNKMKVKIEFWKPDSVAIIKFYLKEPHSQDTCFGLKFYYSFLYFRDFKASIHYERATIYSGFKDLLSEIFREQL